MKYLWIALSAAALGLSAIDAGKPLPPLKVSKWYFRPAAASDRLSCTVLFDINSENSAEVLRMLETLQDEFQFPFSAIAVNGTPAADAYVGVNGPYTIGVGADDALKTRNSLAENESLFPYAVLARDGTVLWTGHPTELEGIVGQVKQDKFSLKRQRKVESLRRELQMAIQSGLPHVVSSTADKILAVSPSDRIAIQSKIMALNSSRRGAEIPAFIRKVCQENPRDLRLRVMELDLALRDDGADFAAAAEKFDRDFPRPDVSLVHPVAYIVGSAPYGILSPALSLRLARRAYDGAAKNPKLRSSAVYAIACETLARVKAERGDFSGAAALQREAVGIRKGSRQEKAARNRLNYYLELEKAVKTK